MRLLVLAMLLAARAHAASGPDANAGPEGRIGGSAAAPSPSSAGAATATAGAPGMSQAPQAAADPDAARREQIKAKIRAQQGGMEPLVRKLRELSGRYRALSDLGAVEPERSRVRRELLEKKAALNKLGAEFRAEMAKQYLSAMPGVVSANGKRRNFEGMMQQGVADDNYYHDIGDAGAGETLNVDETNFQAARKELQAHRQMRTAALLAGVPVASAILGLGAWAVRRRRKSGVPAALPAPGASPAPAAELGGNFRITRELGRGGVGLVYEALDLTLNRKVAVKKLREEFSASPRELEAFLGEARAVAALRHPNVAEIHGVLREGGQVYLVFEFVEGRPLDRLVEERGPLPWAEVRRLLAQVAGALDYAHSLKVLHRNLKPANILVTADGTAKVTDFGLSRRAQATSARLSGNAGCATDPYMAPEQELGASSREADLFSLGACLYGMAVGRAPFPGPDYLSQKRSMRFARPSEAAGLPAGVDELIRKALHPDPNGRFRSASELLAAATTLETRA